MAYVRIKIIKGRPYKYLVKGVRIKKKVQQKVIKYLGAIEPVIKRKKNQGKKPTIFVRELKNEEVLELNKICVRSKDAFKRDRARIIIASSRKKSVPEICKALSKDRKTVVRAIKSFNAFGINALIRKKSKGRPPRFTKEQRAKILQTVLTEPVRLGLHFTTWSLPSMKKYLIDSGIVEYICIESIRNILKSEKSNYKKSKRRLYSNDPNFFKKKLEKDRLKESPPANSVVLSFDEKGCIAIKQFDGQKWMKGKHYFVPERQKVKGLLNFFAVRNIYNGAFHYKFYDFKNSFIVTDFFEYLLRIYPDKHIYIILDNWSAHTSNMTKAFVDLHPRITLVYLPFSASWLNEIENDFSVIERRVLRNSNFQSVRETIDAIIRFVKNDPSFNRRFI